MKVLVFKPLLLDLQIITKDSVQYESQLQIHLKPLSSYISITPQTSIPALTLSLIGASKGLTYSTAGGGEGPGMPSPQPEVSGGHATATPPGGSSSFIIMKTSQHSKEDWGHIADKRKSHRASLRIGICPSLFNKNPSCFAFQTRNLCQCAFLSHHLVLILMLDWQVFKKS